MIASTKISGQSAPSLSSAARAVPGKWLYPETYKTNRSDVELVDDIVREKHTDFLAGHRSEVPCALCGESGRCRGGGVCKTCPKTSRVVFSIFPVLCETENDFEKQT